MMGPVHDTNIIFIFFIEGECQSTQAQNETMHSTEREGRSSTVGRSTYKTWPGAQTVIVRCPDGHRPIC